MSMSNNNTWTKVNAAAKPKATGYVPPSMRKPEAAPEQSFDEMFPEGLLPVAPVKKTVWASNFKAAIEKKDTVETPVKDDTILASYTNPRTGRTTIVRDMPFHPDDNVVEASIAVPNISIIMKKVAAKRRALDDDDDSSFHADEESHVEEEHYDHYSEEEAEETTAEDYVSD
jgi:hypothetical protein